MSTLCSKQWTITISAPSNITAYWTLNESTGSTNRLDSTGGNSTLIPTGVTAPGVPALISNGVQFTGVFGGNSYSTQALAPAISYVAGNSLSFWGWFKINSLGNIAGNGTLVAYDSFQCSIFLAAGSLTDPQPMAISSTLGTVYVPVSLGAWHFFHLFYDHSILQFGYSLDNGPEVLLPGTIDPVSSGGDFELRQGFVLNGDVIFDEVGLLTTSKLTPAQVTYLYNGGAGRTWPISLP